MQPGASWIIGHQRQRLVAAEVGGAQQDPRIGPTSRQLCCLAQQEEQQQALFRWWSGWEASRLAAAGQVLLARAVPHLVRSGRHWQVYSPVLEHPQLLLQTLMAIQYPISSHNSSHSCRAPSGLGAWLVDSLAQLSAGLIGMGPRPAPWQPRGDLSQCGNSSGA